MEKAVQSPAAVLSPGGPAKDESGLFSIVMANRVSSFVSQQRFTPTVLELSCTETVPRLLKTERKGWSLWSAGTRLQSRSTVWN